MKIKLLSLLFGLLYLPFSLFLNYLVLSMLNATELMWFLYWLLIPMAIISGILSKIAEWEED